MNSKIMCELSTINLSVQKKYFIMSESYYSEIKKKYIRMFDEIIVLENNTTSAVLDVFESIWQKQQNVIKGDPLKIKIAALSDFDIDYCAEIRKKYNIPVEKSYDRWNNKIMCYNQAKKGVGTPKFFVLEPRLITGEVNFAEL